MGVACQILVNEAKDGVYKAGEKVTGTVRYAFDKPTTYKAITLSLVGTAHCSWTEHESDDQRTRYYGDKNLLNIHIDLLKNPQRTVTINTGSYKYRFRFHLPENLPASFENYICRIAYQVQVKFEKSDIFSLNKTFSTDIPVYGRVLPTTRVPITLALEKTLLKLFSSEKPVINLQAEILKSTVAPGENARLSIVVTNNTDVRPAVRSELWCFMSYKADCGRVRSTTSRVKGCSSETDDIPGRSVTNISHTVPTTSSAYTIISEVMELEYKLRVTVRLPLPHINASVDVPVIIGKTREMDVDSDDATVDVGVEATENRVLPPSYSEAMSEDVWRSSQ